MPHSPRTDDVVTRMIRAELKRTGVSIPALIAGSGVSRNSVYEGLAGRRGFQSRTATRLLGFLKTKRTK